MEVDFVPYQEALELHNIGAIFPNVGFPHFAIYRNGSLSFANQYATHMFIDDFKDEVFAAPLYQQAFRWFREKYDLNYVIVKAESWFFTINGCNTQEGFNTYEEAELACLRKLIEIIKSKQ
jgi:hypothetical protein